MAKADKSRQLNTKQENAINMILQGSTDNEVADSIGVSRQTVNDWKNNNYHFIAELNRRRQEIWNIQLEYFRSLMAKALSVLEEDLQDQSDKKLRQQAAVHVLKGVGVYGTELTPKGATDPYNVEFQRQDEEIKELIMSS